MENKKGQRKKDDKRYNPKKAGEGNPKLSGPNRPST